jgi:hypothetical protein
VRLPVLDRVTRAIKQAWDADPDWRRAGQGLPARARTQFAVADSPPLPTEAPAAN